MIQAHLRHIMCCQKTINIQRPSTTMPTAAAGFHKRCLLLRRPIGNLQPSASSLAQPALEQPSEPAQIDANKQQQQQFAVLESAAVPCHARISTETPSGCRGLIATRELQSGDVVLAVPATYALSVPRHHPLKDLQATANADWREWLALSQAAHGALPSELIDFLADVNIKADIRIAAWLLYLKQQQQQQDILQAVMATDPSSSSRSDFWRCYLDLLPSLLEYTALDTGLWTDSELQQLEPTIMRALLSCYNTEGQAAAEAAYKLLNSPQQPISTLKLAPTILEVYWALSAAKTRPYHDKQRHCTSLYPLIDIINHASAGEANCHRDATFDGYVVRALQTITAGEEITMSYTDLNLPNNIDIMANWGFVISPNPGDMLLSIPCYFGTLHHVDWSVAVQAAATILQRWQQHSSTGSSREDLQIRLAAAAANLPLLPRPDKQAGSGSSSSSIQSLLNSNAWQQDYLAAVEALQAHLDTVAAATPCLEQQQQHIQQQEQHSEPADVYQPLYQFEEQGSSIQQHFMKDLQHVLQQQQQQSDQLPADSWQPQQQQQPQQPQQQIQAWTALACHNSCRALLASCSTTAEQDALLLPQLYQQQQQQGPASQPDQAGAALLMHQQQQQQLLLTRFDQLQLQLVFLLASNRAYTVLQTAGSLYTEEAILVMEMLPGAAAAAAGGGDGAGGQGNPQQEHTSVLQSLIDALPSWHLDLVSTSSSSSSSSSSRQKPWRDRDLMQTAAARMYDHLASQVPKILAQQDQLIAEMQDTQHTIQPQSVAALELLAITSSSSSSSNGDDVETARAHKPGVSRDRLAAAVAARLEHKRLLAAAAELCGEIAHQLLAS